MLRIPINTEIDSQTFIKNVANLSISELEAFAKEINALIKQKKKKEIKNKEKGLKSKLNQTILSKAKRERVLELSPKVELETISKIEQKELGVLFDEAEELRNKRVEIMIELAHLKSVSLSVIMQELGLKPLMRA